MPLETDSTRRRTPTTASAFRDGSFKDIVGASGRMHRIFKLIAKVAATDSSVLLLGETGTGKELLARSIHLQSRRASGPFVPVNVAAIPATLVESELFGHVRGAFTGASTERSGLIAASDGGTLFLDEIGDMPLEAQVKLLRVLENNEVRRVGENSAHLVDLRVVAATHRDLHEEIAAGRFREDLYYRLSVVTIEVPALRERREDIGLLAEYFLARISKAQGKPELEFSPEAIQLLERYDYPGNVRELENVIAHVVTLSEGPIVTAQDLPDVVRAPRLLTSAPDTRPAERERRPRPLRASLGPREVTVPDARDHWTLAEVEQEHILRVLDRCRGNATAAARQLGISRTTLWRKLREYGVSRPERTGE